MSDKSKPSPPPSTTARHEIETLIFEIRRLKAKVAACEALLREYQAQMHSVVSEYYAKRPRKP